MFRGKISKDFFWVVFLALSFALPCNAMFGRLRGDRLEGLYGDDRALDKQVLKIERLRAMRKIIEEESKRLAELKASYDADNQNNELKKELEEQKQILKDYKESIGKMLVKKNSDAHMGEIIARGLAGKNSEALDDSEITGAMDGLEQGLMVRAAGAIGDFVGEKVKGTVDRVLGGVWDFTENKMVDLWNKAFLAMFHDSVGPFNYKEISGYKTLINKMLLDIERLLKDGLKDSTRGQDMTFRQFDDEDPLSATKQQEASVGGDGNRVWKKLIDGYAAQLEIFDCAIDKHKKYYEGEDSIIIVYAEQIQIRLRDVTSILLSADKSLKDFDALLDSNKSLIVAYRNQIDNLFVQFADLIKPKGESVKEAAKPSSNQDFGYKNRFGDSDDSANTYPFNAKW